MPGLIIPLLKQILGEQIQAGTVFGMVGLFRHNARLGKNFKRDFRLLNRVLYFTQMREHHPVAGAGAANQTGNPDLAVRSAEKELEIDARILKLNPNNATAQRDQALAYRHIAKAHELRGLKAHLPSELREAEAWFQKTVDVYTAQQNNGTLPPMYAADLAETRKSIERVRQEMR